MLPRILSQDLKLVVRTVALGGVPAEVLAEVPSVAGVVEVAEAPERKDANVGAVVAAVALQEVAVAVDVAVAVAEGANGAEMMMALQRLVVVRKGAVVVVVAKHLVDGGRERHRPVLPQAVNGHHRHKASPATGVRHQRRQAVRAEAVELVQTVQRP